MDAKVIEMLRDLPRSALRRILAGAWIGYRVSDTDHTLRARVEGYYMGGAISADAIIAEWEQTP